MVLFTLSSLNGTWHSAKLWPVSPTEKQRPLSFPIPSFSITLMWVLFLSSLFSAQHAFLKASTRLERFFFCLPYYATPASSFLLSFHNEFFSEKISHFEVSREGQWISGWPKQMCHPSEELPGIFQQQHAAARRGPVLPTLIFHLYSPPPPCWGYLHIFIPLTTVCGSLFPNGTGINHNLTPI